MGMPKVQGGWNMNCVYAPTKKFAIHCKKTNEGETKVNKSGGPIKRSRQNGKLVGKGYFGCARHCRFFTIKKGVE